MSQPAHAPILSPDDLEVVPGFEHEKLQGWVPAIGNDDELRNALEKAFDYRGDITITRKDGTQVEGYLFDRRQGKTLGESLVRILPANGPRVSIPYSDVAALRFSGRDSAAGKSWEAWVRKYWEKKASGETAEIEPESLD
jgi:hypothetical protein